MPQHVECDQTILISGGPQAEALSSLLSASVWPATTRVFWGLGFGYTGSFSHPSLLLSSLKAHVGASPVQNGVICYLLLAAQVGCIKMAQYRQCVSLPRSAGPTIFWGPTKASGQARSTPLPGKLHRAELLQPNTAAKTYLRLSSTPGTQLSPASSSRQLHARHPERLARAHHPGSSSTLSQVCSLSCASNSSSVGWWLENIIPARTCDLYLHLYSCSSSSMFDER